MPVGTSLLALGVSDGHKQMATVQAGRGGLPVLQMCMRNEVFTAVEW